MNNRLRGKATERALAKRLGAERVGLLGREDLRDDSFSWEVKNRQKFVGQGFMKQARRNCPPGKTPLVIVHVHNQPHAEDLVMIRLVDWESWMGSTSPDDCVAAP